MGKLTLNKTEGTFTEDAKDGIIEKAIAGVTGMFGDAETEAYTADILLWGQLLTNSVNTVATSMYTRRRAASGKAPIAKVLF